MNRGFVKKHHTDMMKLWFMTSVFFKNQFSGFKSLAIFPNFLHFFIEFAA
jgi:hypothetical protein